MSKLPSRLRPLVRLCALAGASLALHATAAPPADVAIERVWQYAHQGGQKSEIVAYDERSDTLWVAGVVGVDVLDRATGQLVAQVSASHLGAVNSVAIHNGLAALAIENGVDRSQPGVVVFFDTRTRRQLGDAVGVGVLPDMLTFTPDGRQLLVANEGTPAPRLAGQPCPEDPAGSVSIVDLHSRRVTTLPIAQSIPGYAEMRQFPATGNGTTRPDMCAYGPEPEYIAVDKDGRFAHVVLQEANAVAVLDLHARAFRRIYGLGLKDFSLAGNEIDPSDKDGEPRLRSVALKGLYQPDGVAAYEHRGCTYLVMANEGDARDNGSADGEDERRGSAGSGTAELVPEGSELSRLTLSNVDSAQGGPLVAFGGHSFSIRDTAGRIVYDSASLLDREAIRLGIYDDGRSDNKGVEPEGVALLHAHGRVLAFIGLERTLQSAFAVFDVTDPREVRHLDTVVSEGDRSPEGLAAFKIGRRHYLAVANEVSDTTSLFEVKLGRGHGHGGFRR